MYIVGVVTAAYRLACHCSSSPSGYRGQTWTGQRSTPAGQMKGIPLQSRSGAACGCRAVCVWVRRRVDRLDLCCLPAASGSGEPWTPTRERQFGPSEGSKSLVLDLFGVGFRRVHPRQRQGISQVSSELSAAAHFSASHSPKTACPGRGVSRRPSVAWLRPLARAPHALSPWGAANCS